MSDITLSPATTNYIQKAKSAVSTEPIDNKASEKPKIADKKKLACTAAAAIGVITLAATVIHFAKKGNLKGVQQTVEEVNKPIQTTTNGVEKGIKKFFNDNKLIDGVKLDKGKAINSDGSMFSGVMKTINGNGEEIVLEYTDGFIANSTKNGKLIKTY